MTISILAWLKTQPEGATTARIAEYHNICKNSASAWANVMCREDLIFRITNGRTTRYCAHEHKYTAWNAHCAEVAERLKIRRQRENERRISKQLEETT